MSSISTVFWPRYWHISISLKTVRFGLQCFDSSRCVEGGGRSRNLGVSTSKYNLPFYGYLHKGHNDSTLNIYIGVEPCFSHWKRSFPSLFSISKTQCHFFPTSCQFPSAMIRKLHRVLSKCTVRSLDSSSYVHYLPKISGFSNSEANIDAKPNQRTFLGCSTLDLSKMAFIMDLQHIVRRWHHVIHCECRF